VHDVQLEMNLMATPRQGILIKFRSSLCFNILCILVAWFQAVFYSWLNAVYLFANSQLTRQPANIHNRNRLWQGRKPLRAAEAYMYFKDYWWPKHLQYQFWCPFFSEMDLSILVFSFLVLYSTYRFFCSLSFARFLLCAPLNWTWFIFYIHTGWY